MKFDINIPGRLSFVLLACIGVLSPDNAIAQFTYVKAGVGYSNLPIETSASYSSTIFQQLNIGISGMYRPIQNFGVGANFKYPIIQFNSFTFRNDGNSMGPPSFRDWEMSTGSDVRNRYMPNTYDYSFRQSAVFELFGRLFIGKEAALFVDFKYSRFTIEEQFTLYRAYQPQVTTEFSQPYPAIDALNINDVTRHVLNAPGLSVGFLNHLTDYLYFDVALSADFIIFNESGFSYDIEYDIDVPSRTPLEVRMESQTDGLKPLFSLSFGFGLFF